MRKEVKLLKEKSVASLLLSIDHFNRVSDLGRVDVVLILLDHSFEMLLKAGILHRGGQIREKGATNTIGFDACVRRALSSEGVQFLTDEQALVVQTINGLRDAAQHHLLQLSEGQLYLHTQSGVTLFRDLLQELFQEHLKDYLPERALPVSTLAPLEPIAMFAEEVAEVKKLLRPGRRKRAEAEARLRGLAIVDNAIQGSLVQPGDSYLRRLGQRITKGESLEDVFPGISSVQFTAEGTGPEMNLRITKGEGIPVTIVPEGTPGAGVVALKKVDELGFYNLSHKQLAGKVGVTPNKLSAVIWHLGLKDNPECSKLFKLGGLEVQRYSQKSIIVIKEVLDTNGEEEIWQLYKNQLKMQRQRRT